MTSAPPEVLRALTDQQVLELLYDGPRSRAELAAVGGFSKPTASESVRRLQARGLVAETGELRRGAGRSASLVAIRPEAGAGLAVTIDATGVRATTLAVSGATLDESEVALSGAHNPRAVAAALRKAVSSVTAASDVPVRAAAVSAADPVRRSDGRLVELPDAPFLVGSLDARRTLAPYIGGEVLVGNDVNWAARAESAARPGSDDFGYLHLGTGLGGAVVTDGAVRRGHQGLAGEVAHVIVSGPGGRAMPITEVFAEMKLRQRDSTAIDVAAVHRELADPRRAAVLGRALSGVVGAFVGLTDPAFVVVAGPWGDAAVPCLEEALRDCPRPVALKRAKVADPAAAGVRDGAVAALRSWVSNAATRPVE
ncbi:ROK family transcriptional regulator [Flexivirga oryzae]|uniref:Putative NBD/HSP70 family sugar kinase n=1 Tax=Flexivirga oryzae TaxID=1794944 RepID=A0A839N9A3_9MICO|nr:ROK family transcriptional regulator [Flexivirga oryzae]MBB2892226.1 putative NBD/HSP70 family sugar kinase [Flexivirga oryzae]